MRLLGPLAVLLFPLSGAATLLPPFPFSEIDNYLIIGNGPVNDGVPTIGMKPGVGQATNTNNFELGANKAPVPATSDFLNSGGGPGLAGNVPDIPSNAQPVGTGIAGDGNIAVTHPDGVFNLQDVGVYADLGIQCAGDKVGCDVGTQNSFWNDPNQFPNTFDPGTGTGILVNPNDADQTTRIDKPLQAGVTGDVDFTALIGQLNGAAAVIPGLPQTDTLDLTLTGGKISTDTVITLLSGLSAIDILTGGNDFLLENSNLVIDGPANAFAIFRVPDDKNFLVANSNILVGTSGIGLNNVLFYSDSGKPGQHFNFNNTVLNGVAFWSLSPGGEINFDNSQGCTQLIADKVTLNDVRFSRCAFAPIPEPSAALLFPIGLLVVSWALREQRTPSRPAQCGA